MTVQVKTSLVRTSIFATSAVHNFPWERHTELKFVVFMEQTSIIFIIAEIFQYQQRPTFILDWLTQMNTFHKLNILYLKLRDQ